MSITAFVEAVAQELRLRGVSFHEQSLLLFLVRYVGTIPGARGAERWADEFTKAVADSARRTETGTIAGNRGRSWQGTW